MGYNPNQPYIKPAKVDAKLRQMWGDFVSAVAAPGNAANGKYRLMVDQMTGENYYDGMAKDATGLAGLLTLGAGAVPAEAGALRMGMGKPSEALNRWFGGSKVVGEAGKPLVVYHGTRAQPFSEFSLSKAGTATDSGYLGKGFYFTDKPNVASIYAGDGSVYPVHLAIKNPLEIKAKMDGRREVDREKVVRDILGLPPKADAQDVTDAARAAGHDGVVYVDPFGGREYVAFDPEQIKSKFNQGTYDTNDPNIMRAGGIPIPQSEDRKDKRQIVRK